MRFPSLLLCALLLESSPTVASPVAKDEDRHRLAERFFLIDHTELTVPPSTPTPTPERVELPTRHAIGPSPAQAHTEIEVPTALTRHGDFRQNPAVPHTELPVPTTTESEQTTQAEAQTTHYAPYTPPAVYMPPAPSSSSEEPVQYISLPSKSTTPPAYGYGYGYPAPSSTPSSSQSPIYYFSSSATSSAASTSAPDYYITTSAEYPSQTPSAVYLPSSESATNGQTLTISSQAVVVFSESSSLLYVPIVTVTPAPAPPPAYTTNTWTEGGRTVTGVFPITTAPGGEGYIAQTPAAPQQPPAYYSPAPGASNSTASTSGSSQPNSGSGGGGGGEGSGAGSSSAQGNSPAGATPSSTSPPGSRTSLGSTSGASTLGASALLGVLLAAGLTSLLAL